MDEITLRRVVVADAPWLVEQHGVLYQRDEGFDQSFAPLVATILDRFFAGADPSCETGWIAQAGDQKLGSVFCVKTDEYTAKLRLFLLLPEARGKGLGKRLLLTCMDYARSCGYREMELWTHESHRAACALYAAHGWTLESSKPVRSFGVDLVEQSWRITL